MVDNRAAGFYGIGGSFNFKSGDISGTAAKTSDDKSGPGTEYAPPVDEDENETKRASEPFTDRSAQLRATLNSLAMMNVASVINSKLPKKNVGLENVLDESELIVPKVKSEEDEKKHKNKKKKSKHQKKHDELEEAFY